MYLSRIPLDTMKRNTLKALNSPSIFHGAIESSFSGERQRRLWRLDSLNNQLYILVLSDEKPDFSSLLEQFGAADGEVETRDYDQLLERVTNGSRWRFKLTANPTKSVSVKGKRGTLEAITLTHLQREWLEKRAEGLGFSLNKDSFDVTQSRWVRFYKKGERTVSILSVSFEGVLEVTDAEVFKRTLSEGVGRAKAYGMGLLTIMRA